MGEKALEEKNDACMYLCVYIYIYAQLNCSCGDKFSS